MDYYNKFARFLFDDEEINNIENAWKFLDVFKMNYIFVSEYRDHVINEVRDKYTIDQFYKYENILNKMFWNIRYVIAVLMTQKINNENELIMNIQKMNEIPISLTLCDKIDYKDDKELNDLIHNNYVVLDGRYSHYRSFINKLVIIDKINKCVWMKNMEGSADIFSKNYFNQYTMTILFNKDIYEKFMKEPLNAIKDKTKLSKYYFQYDYPFPNLNCCMYLIGSNDDRIERIHKMYFNETGDKSKYWYKII